MSSWFNYWIVFLVCVAGYATSQDKKVTWKDCSTPKYHGKINSVLVSPNPLVRNQDTTISVNTTIDEEVTGGKLKGTIYGRLYNFTQEFNLCDVVSLVGQWCPIPKGPMVLTAKLQDGNFDPSGTYKVHGEVTDQNGESLFCLDIVLPM